MEPFGKFHWLQRLIRQSKPDLSALIQFAQEGVKLVLVEKHVRCLRFSISAIQSIECHGEPRVPTMTAQLSYPYVEKIDGKPAHLQRWPRIRIAQLAMDYLAYGWSPDEMCRQHPFLSTAEVHAAMVYYYDHQAEIDGEIERELDQVDKDICP